MRKITMILILCSLLLGTARAQTNPPVPASYQDLYTQLNGQMTSFNAALNSKWNGSPYPVVESAQLLSAASEVGTPLLTPSHWGVVQGEIQSLQALGVKSLTVHIDFPLLNPAFSPNYQAYLNFYVQLGKQIHAMGLKMIVENSVIFPQPGLSPMSASAFYATLSWPEYEQARAQQAALIAQQVKPDYLSLITEPDTEANATLQNNVNTVSGATDMLNQMLAAIQSSGATGVSLGAGMGTWLSGFEDFATSFAATSVAYLDMHIYPVNGTYLYNAVTIARIAQAAGKQAAMSEAWLYKVRNSELGSSNSTTIYGRDPFNFWEPLDQDFLQTIHNIAQYEQMAFISPFFTTYFHAYLDYATYGSDTAPLALAVVTVAAETAIQQAQFTPTGTGYEKLFVALTRTSPPSEPSGLAYTASATTIALTWAASTNNVGVAGYHVYRNGVLVATTSGLSYLDSNLTEDTLYVYSLSAFDALQNTSPQMSIAATTLSVN